ncbi:hypothetical protein MLD38_017388 [Melastoma candidum]|uniref:Uncharacterized protein n=1 Tax=Melastoma candidum TaxID=119954 RepID=A0ACB9QPN0_9MYRT|nr:hypothetical protein MLD38_017388 [Melastoma candidum]
MRDRRRPERTCILPLLGNGEDVESARRPKRSPPRELSDIPVDDSPWNPRDPKQMRMVKEALHLSAMPNVKETNEDEQMKVLEFCKESVGKEKAGSVYAGLLQPDVLAVNCTSLSRTSEIFSKISVPINQQRRLIVQPPTCNFCNIFTGKFILFPTLLKLDSCICAKDTISLQHQQVITCSAVKLF